MPHELMNDKQAAAYLHMELREVLKLAARGKVPCRKTAGGFVFRKSDLDHWVEQQLHKMDKRRLEQIEKGVTKHHGLEQADLELSRLIPPDGIAVPLHARTKDSVLRELVGLADERGLLHDADRVLREVRSREDLCSTGILPGVAIPHPRHPLPHDIDSSFVVVGATSSGVPFGAPDGSLTRLFFLVCCKNDRTHLHVLARLGRILHDASALQAMMDAHDSAELKDILTRREQQVTGGGEG